MPKMRITIDDIDLGFDESLKALMGLDGAVVEAGLLDPEQAQIGAWHEYGTVNMPARPWLSIAADTGRPAIAKAAKVAVGQVADGTAAAQALEHVGDVTATLAREVITMQKMAGKPLADTTILRKGTSERLIDTGEMLYSIEHKVFVK